MKPKMKNHYRAHQLSVWLRLVPELHRAGMEDVEPRHNLFRGYADPSLYDGFVRPDPLSRVASTSEEPGSAVRRTPGQKSGNATTEQPTPTTTDYSLTTCVSLIQSTNIQNLHNASTDTLASLDAAGWEYCFFFFYLQIIISVILLYLNNMHYAELLSDQEPKNNLISEWK